MPWARPIIAGNWKMNGLRADGLALADALVKGASQGGGAGTLAIFPPATLLAAIAQRLAGSQVLLGGQDCAPQAKGAFTGDLSAPMLQDAGCRLVIVGHSERRQGHGETDALVQAKAKAAHAAGLAVVLCIGETEAEWQAGQTLAVLDRQLEGSLPEGASAEWLIVAYEPVWAIGTGRTPTAADIERTHAHLRKRLGQLVPDGASLGLLYGGSVKAANAGEILAIPEVDGVLVGGACLQADEFLAIRQAGSRAAR